jgi:hypothetical protein
MWGKKFWMIMLCLGGLCAEGKAQLFQPQIQDWQGTKSFFQWNDDQVIQSTLPTETYLTVAYNKGTEQVWTVDLELGFNPSNANQFRLHLISDHENVLQPHQGYYLQIGESGNQDRYQLYKSSPDGQTLLLSTIPIPRTNPAHIREKVQVKRDQYGYFQIQVIGEDEQIIKSEVVLDTTFFDNAFSGFSCHFTAANSQRFTIHQFYIDQLQHNLGIDPQEQLKIQSIAQENLFEIGMLFNKTLDPSMLEDPSRFRLEPHIGSPKQIRLEGHMYLLQYENPIAAGTYTLLFDSLLVFTSQTWQQLSPQTFVAHMEPPSDALPLLRPDSIPEISWYSDFSQPYEQTWIGDLEKVILREQRLGLREKVESPIRLYFPQTAVLNQVWELGLEIHKELSSNNYIRVYLSASDQIFSPHQGYHLQIDGSNKQYRFRIYRQNGSSRNTLFETPLLSLSQPLLRARIRVNCSSEGLWTLALDTLGTGSFHRLSNIDGQDTWSHQAHTNAAYSGLSLYTTSTRTQDFYIHYFLLHPLSPKEEDEVPQPHLKIKQIQPDPSGVLLLHFEVKPDSLTALNPQLYQLLQTQQSPRDLMWEEDHLKLLFDPFTDGTYTLQILDTLIQFKISTYPRPIPGELLITEVMTQPKANVGLPATEYIEIYNASAHRLQLLNYTFELNGRKLPISMEVIMEPGSYVCFVPMLGSEEWGPGFMPLPQWLALNNEELHLRLLDDLGVQLDEVILNKKLHASSNKRSGGWSYEKRHALYPCFAPINWTSSVDPLGGTPGKQNSVSATELPKWTAQISQADSLSLTINFDESITHLSPWETHHIRLNPTYLTCTTITYLDEQNIVLTLNVSLPEGVEIQVQMEAEDFCTGLRFPIQLSTYIPFKPQEGDVMINEILFDPKAGGVEFIELYNASEKTFDLQHFSIATLQNGQPSSAQPIISESWMLQPQQYAVITSNPFILHAHYPKAKVETMHLGSRLPQLRNAGGELWLLNQEQRIDHLYYHPQMHDPFLVNTKGISLERLNLKRLKDPPQLYSSSSLDGGATPGYQNSQFQPNPSASPQAMVMQLVSKRMSPDGDGYEDVLLLNYTMDQPGYQIKLDIINDKGQLLHTLFRHELLGTSGQISWDGQLPSGRKIPEGLYALHMHVYHSKGWQKISRQGFYVVGHRLR